MAQHAPSPQAPPPPPGLAPYRPDQAPASDSAASAARHPVLRALGVTVAIIATAVLVLVVVLFVSLAVSCGGDAQCFS